MAWAPSASPSRWNGEPASGGANEIRRAAGAGVDRHEDPLGAAVDAGLVVRVRHVRAPDRARPTASQHRRAASLTARDSASAPRHRTRRAARAAGPHSTRDRASRNVPGHAPTRARVCARSASATSRAQASPSAVDTDGTSSASPGFTIPALRRFCHIRNRGVPWPRPRSRCGEAAGLQRTDDSTWLLDLRGAPSNTADPPEHGGYVFGPHRGLGALTERLTADDQQNAPAV